jgi:hypothetical protein
LAVERQRTMAPGPGGVWVEGEVLVPGGDIGRVPEGELITGIIVDGDDVTGAAGVVLAGEVAATGLITGGVDTGDEAAGVWVCCCCDGTGAAGACCCCCCPAD